ncbi:nucleotidyltransferase domain-containing protein [Domibacillus epiphyticus]|uniref:Nucleotidyltransferase n=1 Tax=Domibacillus epiphyticus TaxID=1714355 RepID=A0A1V2AA71_9BACI|nr:nucleotidyltransferase domain-containing protein [Domibacillus epiphyticus]OMP67893.1 hypothetical protein BTO28_05240 [Domibacillus epiphyticus]
MRKTIINTLKKLESDYNVKVLYACESGSRAWGFPSRYSDYDVRFIYVHPPETYLSIDPVGIGKKRDVIDVPMNDLLDVSGWELTKALKLFRKSNPPLLEWLHSTIIYYEAFSTIHQMKKLNNSIISPASCLHHYLNMANKNVGALLHGEQVKMKMYFNALRPVLAAKWIEQLNEFPPLEFQQLLERFVPNGEVRTKIDILLKRKMTGDMIGSEPRIDLIKDFLTDEIARLESSTKRINVKITDPTFTLDQLFRDTLKEVWG